MIEQPCEACGGVVAYDKKKKNHFCDNCGLQRVENLGDFYNVSS